MTTIKITQLPSIGNNLSASTILPVVSTSGVSTTDRTTLGSMANYVLAEAGNLLPPAFVSTLAYSVVNAAQPNITSVGTLGINTLIISGGTNGQYIQTDGTGNLAWVSGGGTGNGVVGGSDTQIQFNNAGNFGGNPGLTWNGGTGSLSTLKLSVSSGATIYGNTALSNLNVADTFTTNNIFTDNYFYANGDPFGGDGNTGNIAFDNTIIYSLSGATLDNSDLAHDATGQFVVPANGGGNVEVNNTYGNVLVQTGVDGTEFTGQWKFDNEGNLTLPYSSTTGNTSVTMNNIGNVAYNSASPLTSGGSLEFVGDELDHFLVVPNEARFAPGTGDFTIEWYQYVTSNSHQYPRPFSLGVCCSNINSFLIGLYEPDPNMMAIQTQSGYNPFTGWNDTLNVWQHIAVVRSSGTITIYQDGVAFNSPHRLDR